MNHEQRIPNVPDGCEVFGYLYEGNGKVVPGEDMLDVRLPNGILVVAGWFEECEPKGAYRVSVLRGYEEIVPALESEDINQAMTDVETRVEEFHSRNLYVSNAENTVCDFDLQAAA